VYLLACEILLVKSNRFVPAPIRARPTTNPHWSAIAAAPFDGTQDMHAHLKHFTLNDPTGWFLQSSLCQGVESSKRPKLFADTFGQRSYPIYLFVEGHDLVHAWN
jgi:hypothetical protein